MVLIVYIMLAILFAMLTAGLYVYTVLDPQVHLIYTFLKCFYLVLFVLWIHKYFTIKFTKLLGLNEDNNKPEEDFFRKQIDIFFS